jgi:hypothetical protein
MRVGLFYSILVLTIIRRKEVLTYRSCKSNFSIYPRLTAQAINQLFGLTRVSCCSQPYPVYAPPPELLWKLIACCQYKVLNAWKPECKGYTLTASSVTVSFWSSRQDNRLSRIESQHNFKAKHLTNEPSIISHKTHIRNVHQLFIGLVLLIVVLGVRDTIRRRVN